MNASPKTLHGATSRFALVLGSGGVKSVAALGVAEVLLQEGLKPDLIAGCSAGAVFGALLASGHDAATCIAMARSLWSREITSQRQRGAWWQLASSTVHPRGRRLFGESFALRDGSLIEQRLQQAFGHRQLEALPTRLRVNATCAGTGDSVVLTHGSVWHALRASIALPFLFAPHRIGDRLMVDGSVSDPLPLSAVVGARTVLAVGFPVPMPRKVNGPTRLATRITASLTNNLLRAHIAAHAGPRTVVLLPSLERRIGLFETDAMPDLIELGRRAARDVLPQLHALLGDPRHVEPPAALAA